jgi:hypothetical protein
MEPAQRSRVRDVASVAGWSLLNLVLLAVIALTLADRRDDSATINSATPVADGALIALTVVVALALANGALLCLAPRTRRVGVGILVGAIAAVPAGLVIVVGFLSTSLY